MTDWLLTQSLIGSVLIVLLSGLQRAMPVTFGVGNLYKLWLLLPLSLLLSLLPTLHPPLGAMDYLVTGFHKTQSAISGNAYAQSNLLLWIWACGAGLFFLKLLLKVQVTSRLLKQASELDVRRYLPADLSEELHRQRVVTLQSEQINSPCVAGVFQSYLLLPKNLVNQVPPQQLEHIVQHELCHIQRRDVFWNVLVQGYLLIFWFKPIGLVGSAAISIESGAGVRPDGHKRAYPIRKAWVHADHVGVQHQGAGYQSYDQLLRRNSYVETSLRRIDATGSLDVFSGFTGLHGFRHLGDRH